MPRSRAAFSRGRSLNGRNPSRKVSFAGKINGTGITRGAHGAFLVIGRCYLIKHNNLVVDAVVKLRRILLINGFSSKKKKGLREIEMHRFKKSQKSCFFNRKKECRCCFVDLYFLIFLFFFFLFHFTFIFIVLLLYFFIYTLDYYIFISIRNNRVI